VVDTDNDQYVTAAELKATLGSNPRVSDENIAVMVTGSGYLPNDGHGLTKWRTRAYQMADTPGEGARGG
jgi:hypothetical protein